MNKLALLLAGGIVVATAIYISKHDISQMNKLYNRLKRQAKQLHIARNLRKGFKKQVKAFRSASQWLGTLGNGNLAKSHQAN